MDATIESEVLARLVRVAREAAGIVALGDEVSEPDGAPDAVLRVESGELLTRHGSLYHWLDLSPSGSCEAIFRSAPTAIARSVARALARLECQVDRSAPETSIGLPQGNLRELIGALEGMFGVLATAVFPASATFPVLLEVWSGREILAVVGPADAPLFVLRTGSRAARRVLAFEEHGLRFAVLLLRQPAPAERDLLRVIARLRLTDLGFEPGEPILGRISCSRASRGDGSRSTGMGRGVPTPGRPTGDPSGTQARSLQAST